MADVSVREARPGDAAEIARIQLETWRTAYAEILPTAVLDELAFEQAQAVWASAVGERPSARHHVLVAMESQWVVGFTAFGPTDELAADDPDPSDTAAVAPLLVEPRWGRRGHGSRLLAAAVDHARLDGITRFVTWLPEGDTVSRGFLTSAGWAPDGLVRALDTGSGELREVRLHTALAEGPE